MSAGGTIRMLRKKSGLTQKQLAVKMYTSQEQISIYETGKTDPSVKIFEQILNVLGYELVVRRRENEQGETDKGIAYTQQL